MIVPNQSPLNEVVYAGADYPSLVDRILRRMKATLSPEEYNDYTASSIGVTLVELMAYSQAQGIWYMNRLASESFLKTARTREGVSRICEQVGYKMTPAASASTEVQIVFASALTANGTFPAGFQFVATNGRVFETVAAQPLTAGQTTLTMTVREGQTKRLTFVSRGTASQQFRLSSVSDTEFLASGSVNVTVNSALWLESEFLTFDQTNQFEVGYQDEPPTVRFGDGQAGNIPPLGASIEVSFVAIHGVNGNVTAGQITVVKGVLVVGGQVITMSVTNQYGATGGTDPESLESAKTNAPRYFAARNSAITLPDYLGLVSSFTDPEYGSVDKSWATAVRDAQNDPGTVSRVNNLVNGSIDGFAAVESFNNAAASSIANVASDANQIIATSIVISGLNGQIESDNASVGIDVQAASVKFSEIDVTKNLINDQLQALLEIFPSAYPWVTAILANVSSIGTSVTAGNGLCSAAIAVTNMIDDNCALIVLENAANIAKANTIKASAASAGTSLVLAGAEIDVAQADIPALQSDLLVYLSGLFSEDCKANVVTVPILTRDANGFYARPSEGLIRRLQSYLDGICEVTQMPQVVSGDSALLYADITVSYKLLQTAVPSIVASGIQLTLDNMLKNMDFSQRLNLSDMFNSIREQVSGIDYLNIEITDPVSKIDPNGNLVPLDTEIVTKGTVTLTVVT